MMVKGANDGLLQANDGKMLVNDGEMLVKDGKMLGNDDEMSIWSYTYFTIIDKHFTIINKHFTIIGLKFTIIRSFDHHWEAALTAEVRNENLKKLKLYIHFLKNSTCSVSLFVNLFNSFKSFFNFLILFEFFFLYYSII